MKTLSGGAGDLPDNEIFQFPPSPAARTEMELFHNSMPCDDLHALDLSVWHQLRFIAKQSPRSLARDLNFRLKTVELLADTDDERLFDVASGVFSTCRLVVPEKPFAHLFLAVKTTQSNGIAGTGRKRVIGAGSPLNALMDDNLKVAELHLVFEYLRYARDLAKASGIASARVKLDLPEGVLGRLTLLSDVEIRAILQEQKFSTRIEIRFDEKILVELLTSEITTHFKLCQYQSVIQKTVSKSYQHLESFRAWREHVKSSVPANVLDSSAHVSQDKAVSASREKLAVHYLLLGLHTAAVRELFGFSDSVMSKLRHLASQLGAIPKSRHSSGAFIQNHPTQIQANLLACIYTNLSSDYKNAVSVPALLAALEVFYALRVEAGITNPVRWPLINSSKAYCLMSELVLESAAPDSAQAYASDCVTCSLPVYVWLRQKRTEAKICCFCQLGDAKRINSA